MSERTDFDFQPERVRKNHDCLSLFVGGLIAVALIVFVFPRLARTVAHAAVEIDSRSDMIGLFFWAITIVSALPAAGLAVLFFRLGAARGSSGRDAAKIAALSFLALGWPMFLAGTQYRSVSAYEFSNRFNLSLWGTEFIQNAAIAAWSATFVSFFSIYAIGFSHRKYGPRAARIVLALFLLIMAVAVILVGRNVGADYF